MSSFVNKVKEALHSAHDTPSDQRTGKLDLSAEERERLQAAGYGAEHKADKRHLGATEDIANAPGGHHPSDYLSQEQHQGTSAVPGAFPGSEQETVGTHHKDGREYVAPSGTRVGGQSAYSQQDVPDRALMDPADRGTASNVMGAPSVPGANTRSTDAAYETGTTTGTGTGTGTAGIVSSGKHEHSGHNKLHKKDDPRGHVAFNEPTTREAIHSTQGTHGTSGTSATPNTRDFTAATGVSAVSSTTGTHGTHGTHGTYETPGTHGTHETPGTYGTHGTRGETGAGGILGTGTTHGAHGAHETHGTHGTRGEIGSGGILGSSTTTHGTHGPHGTSDLHRKPVGEVGGDVYDQQASRGYADNTSTTPNYSYPTSTSAGPGTAAAATAGVVGAGAVAASHVPERKHHDERSAYTISNKDQPQNSSHVSSAGISGDSSHSRGHGVYNTVTGAGSPDDPHGHHHTSGENFASHPGVSTGSNATPRDAGDSRIASGHGNTAATAVGAGAVGAGVTGLASHHHDGKRHELGTSAQPTSASMAPTTGHTSSNTASTGFGNPASSTSAPLPATLTSAGIGGTGTTTGTSASNQHATYGTGSGAYPDSSTTARSATGQGYTSGTTTTGGLGSTAVGSSGNSEHYGPGHIGAKVLHTCTKCGEDNDITHYFKKDIVYRISH